MDRTYMEIIFMGCCNITPDITTEQDALHLFKRVYLMRRKLLNIISEASVRVQLTSINGMNPAMVSKPNVLISGDSFSTTPQKHSSPIEIEDKSWENQDISRLPELLVQLENRSIKDGRMKDMRLKKSNWQSKM